MNNEEKILSMLEIMNGRFDKVDEHLVKIDGRLDKIEVRLDKIEERLDIIEDRLDIIEDRLDIIEERLDNIEERLDNIEERLDNIEERLDKVEERLDNLEDQYESLRVSILNIELTQYPRIAAALDGVLAAKDHLDTLDKQQHQIEAKVNRHEMEFFLMKRNTAV